MMRKLAGVLALSGAVAMGGAGLASASPDGIFKFYADRSQASWDQCEREKGRYQYCKLVEVEQGLWKVALANFSAG
ncbi:hypothetical protein ACFVMC_18805 [Nocardia sp. NPDC127579]|uniref:hypothetical protein n=1 Tax=Nocardia sp. NPDC127579 TaxID=3345402 RepID=UPI00363A9481